MRHVRIHTRVVYDTLVHIYVLSDGYIKAKPGPLVNYIVLSLETLTMMLKVSLRLSKFFILLFTSKCYNNKLLPICTYCI